MKILNFAFNGRIAIGKMQFFYAYAVVFFAFIQAPAWANADVERNWTRAEVLMQMSHVWIAARLFHPFAATDVQMWDQEFIKAIDDTPATVTSAAIRAVLERWLATLNDPSTAIAENTNAIETGQSEQVFPRKLSEGVYQINLGGLPVSVPFATITSRLKAIGPELADARAVVFDLRAPKGAPSHNSASIVDRSGILEYLLKSSPHSLMLRTRYYSGFVPELANVPSTFERGFRYRPIDLPFSPRSQRDVRLIFVVDRGTTVPVSALALQLEGRAMIIKQGRDRYVYDNLPDLRTGNVPESVDRMS